jgi:hypothetical protein
MDYLGNSCISTRKSAKLIVGRISPIGGGHCLKCKASYSTLIIKLFIQPHRTPDSCLEIERQPEGLKQVRACGPKMASVPAGEVSLAFWVNNNFRPFR